MILKLRIGLCALILFAFTSCSINYKVAENKLSFDKDITIDILKVNSAKEQNVGTGKLLPPRKHVFIYLTVQVKNNSSSDQVVDLTKIVLLHAESKTKYQVGKILLPTILMLPAKDDLKLKADEQAKRILMFNYPEKERPELLEINGIAEQIKYL